MTFLTMVPSSYSWSFTLQARTIESVMSKFADDIEDGMAGRSFPHCVTVITFLVFSDFNFVAFFSTKTL